MSQSSSFDGSASGSRGDLVIVGLGYIGLPTAVVFANTGWSVTGVDISDRVIDSVNAGVLPFVEPELDVALATAVGSGRLKAQKEMPSADVFILAVPTPINSDRTADLQFLETAIRAVAPCLERDGLVIVESTSPPGATEHLERIARDLRPDLVDSDQTFAVKFAHAPERVLPGKMMQEITSNDRIVGGTTAEATCRARDLYASFCKGDIHTSDARTAELAKLAENSFRDVNIAFANELSMVCDELGIDVWRLIELANFHPRVNILNPGPGVGGHCIAVDPWFIVQSAPDSSQLIRLAREVNDGKPTWVLDKVREQIKRRMARTSSIGILGLSFKPDVDDFRSSPAVDIATHLVEEFRDSKILVAEPHLEDLSTLLPGAENAKLVPTIEAAMADIVVILVAHSAFLTSVEQLRSRDSLVDACGLLRNARN